MNKYSIEKLPSDILAEIAMKHRKLRKMAKLSQAELADRSGVSLGSVKRFERTGQVSLESLLRLASILGRLDDFNSLFVVNEDYERLSQLFNDKKK